VPSYDTGYSEPSTASNGKHSTAIGESVSSISSTSNTHFLNNVHVPMHLNMKISVELMKLKN